MRITAADHDPCLHGASRQPAQGAHNLERDVVRVGATHRDQDLAGPLGRLPLPTPPAPEFAPQQQVGQPQEKPCRRLDVGIEARIRLQVLVQHQIGGIVPGMPVVVHRQDPQASLDQPLLDNRAELVSVQHDPAGAQTLRQRHGLAGVGLIARFEGDALDPYAIRKDPRSSASGRDAEAKTARPPDSCQACAAQAAHHMPGPQAPACVRPQKH